MKMQTKNYQKKKERLQKEACESYQNLSEERKKTKKNGSQSKFY